MASVATQPQVHLHCQQRAAEGSTGSNCSPMTYGGDFSTIKTRNDRRGPRTVSLDVPMACGGKREIKKKGLAKRKKGKVKDDLMVWLASCSRWIHALPPGGLGLCASPEPNPASKDPVRTFVLDLSSVLLQADWRAMLLEKTHVMYLC